MVYFKRKSVQVPPVRYRPSEADAQVWVIEPTLEYFSSYDEYLRRLDFYSQKKFICELTGHSCLSFFEALECETKESRQVVEGFPEIIKEPILRLVQFSTISRLDQLVDDIYLTLRREYFLGETVYTRYQDQRVRVTVREKAHFNDITLPNGDVKKGHFRYRVELYFDPSIVLDVESADLTRDRKLFNKVSLRTFIKHAASRENWSGCPWTVRSKYTEKYRINTEMPADLKFIYDIRFKAESQRPAKAVTNGKARSRADSAATESFRLEKGGTKLSLDSAPEPRRRRNARADQHISELPGDDLSKLATREAQVALGRRVNKVAPLPPMHTAETVLPEYTGKLIEIWSFLNVYNDLLVLEPISYDVLLSSLQAYASADEQLVVDEIHAALLSLFVAEGESSLAIPLPLQDEPPRKKKRGRKPKVVVEDEDQDVSEEQDADEGTAADPENEVGDDPDADADAEDAEEEEDEDDEERESTQPMTERGEGNKSDPQDDSATPEPRRPASSPPAETLRKIKKQRVHRGSDYLEVQGVSWLEKIGKRQFAQGGWQTALIAFLNSITYMREWKEPLDRILKVLAPLDRPANQGNAARFYGALDPQDRIFIMHILCRTLYTSQEVRQFMESRSDDLARVRKERAEYNRQAKAINEKLRALKDERNLVLGNLFETEMKRKNGDLPGDSDAGTPLKAEEDPDTAIGADPAETSQPESEHDTAVLKSQLEQLNDTKKELSRELRDVDAKIREANHLLSHYEAHRLRYLGKDRYFNRYWWVEVQGMDRLPDEGANNAEGIDTEDVDTEIDPPSEPDSTSTPGYLMGRLWVQGPTEEDFRVFLDNEDYNKTLIDQQMAVYSNDLAARTAEVESERARLKSERRAQVLAQKRQEEEAALRERRRKDAEALALEKESTTWMSPKAAGTTHHGQIMRFDGDAPSSSSRKRKHSSLDATVSPDSSHQEGVRPTLPQSQAQPVHGQPIPRLQSPQPQQHAQQQPQPRFQMAAHQSPPQMAMQTSPPMIGNLAPGGPYMQYAPAFNGTMPYGGVIYNPAYMNYQMVAPQMMGPMMMYPQIGAQPPHPGQGPPMGYVIGPNGQPMLQSLAAPPMYSQAPGPFPIAFSAGTPVSNGFPPSAPIGPGPNWPPATYPDQLNTAVAAAASTGAAVSPKAVQAIPSAAEPAGAPPGSSGTETGSPRQLAKDLAGGSNGQVAGAEKPEMRPAVDILEAQTGSTVRKEPAAPALPAEVAISACTKQTVPSLAAGTDSPLPGNAQSSSTENGVETAKQEVVAVINTQSQNGDQKIVPAVLDEDVTMEDAGAMPGSELDQIPELKPNGNGTDGPTENEQAIKQESVDEKAEMPKGVKSGADVVTAKAETADVDTEFLDSLPPLPEMMEFKPFNALESKNAQEADPLLKPTDWRYYETVDEFDQFYKALMRLGDRENVLRQKLEKIAPWIRSSLTARQAWLSSESEPWTNKLALDKLGHMHTARRKRRL